MIKKRNSKQISKHSVEALRRKRGTILSPRKEIYSPERNDNKDAKDDIFERKWIVGDTISKEGTVINSPGLIKMVRDIEKLKVRPKLFLEKSLKKTSLFPKFNAEAYVQTQMDRISEYLGREFKPNEAELGKLKKEREKKQRIVSRFNEISKSSDKREAIDAEALLKEIQAIVSGKKKIAGLSKMSQRLENIQEKDPEESPVILNPFIKIENLEDEFQKVFKQFLEDIRLEQSTDLK